MTNAFDQPEGVQARGTVLVAPGRGESADAYVRFGRRIAADGYRVRIVDGTDPAAAEKLLVDDAAPAPRVVVGSDTGALVALDLARRAVPGLDAVVLAGLPVPRDPSAVRVDWESELDARTACPAHRGVLDGGAVERGALFAAPLPAAPAATPGEVRVPVLGLHGDADAISPLAEAAPAYPRPPVVVAGARHDVLNDVSHRTVAATVVLFLERLRLGPDLPLIARHP